MYMWCLPGPGPQSLVTQGGHTVGSVLGSHEMVRQVQPQEEGRRKTKLFILRFLKREAGHSTQSLMRGTRVERRPKWLERGEPRPGPSSGFPQKR